MRARAPPAPTAARFRRPECWARSRTAARVRRRRRTRWRAPPDTAWERQSDGRGGWGQAIAQYPPPPEAASTAASGGVALGLAAPFEVGPDRLVLPAERGAVVHGQACATPRSGADAPGRVRPVALGERPGLGPSVLLGRCVPHRRCPFSHRATPRPPPEPRYVEARWMYERRKVAVHSRTAGSGEPGGYCPAARRAATADGAVSWTTRGWKPRARQNPMASSLGTNVLSSIQPTEPPSANRAASWPRARPTPLPRWSDRTITPESSRARSSENREGTRTSAYPMPTTSPSSSATITSASGSPMARRYLSATSS